MKEKEQTIIKLPAELKERIYSGKTLQEIRAKIGISQSEVANLIGLTYQAYAHYEKGRRQISLLTALRIAIALKITVEDVLIAELILFS